MEVKIKRIDTTLPLPAYQSSGAAAFDLYSRTDYTVAPQSLGFIPTNLIIATPVGYMLVVTVRSSTPKKKGLLVPHGIGIVDPDYCGPDDEILLQVYNYTTLPVKIARGERIGQGVFVKIEAAQWNETSELTATTRGGFGSTG